MKRVNEGLDGEGEGSGLKKVRFFDGNDENFGTLERNESEKEEGGFGDLNQEKGEGGFVDLNQDFFENGNLSGRGSKELNMWDLDDINFDMLFSNDELRKSFDMNVPLSGIESGVGENSYVGHAQGPVINENKKEIIEIGSDDSDDDVQIIGFSSGYEEKGKQIELGMPADRIGWEDLSLELGMAGMGNVTGESSFLTGGERRYTREEKGKANVEDPWLSLNATWPIEMEFPPNFNEPIWINEPGVLVENVEPVSPVAERVVIERDLNEEALRIRRRLSQEHLRRSAKIFARGAGKPSTEKEKPPALEAALEHLGKAPGPFSEALKIVKGRIPKKKEAPQLIEWKPSEENRNKSVTEPIVPSLLDLSLRGLAENADRIVSLKLVPDFLRRRLTDLLCDRSKMNGHILNLLVEGCPAEIRIKNCSWLNETQFRETFENCQTKSLRVLQLDLCGQCTLDYALRDTFFRFPNAFPSLAILSLRGACRLSDNDLRQLVVSAPRLRSINLGQSPLLTEYAISVIALQLGPNLRELYIDGCPKIDAMLTIPAFEKLSCLEVLSVSGLRGVTDEFVRQVIDICGQSIKELDLADCLDLTDWSLKIIGSSCTDLCSLNISNVNGLTDMGLEYLANGCRSIQKLKFLRNGFSDEAMAAFIESSGNSLVELLLNNMTEVGPNTALSIAKRSRKLSSLDISWCRRITNEALGLIVDSCSSLKLLKVFGCRQISEVFVHGHSNGLVRIIGLNKTPIMDHLNLFEPNEGLHYSPIPVCTEEK